jgi:hypothetical protein
MQLEFLFVGIRLPSSNGFAVGNDLAPSLHISRLHRAQCFCTQAAVIYLIGSMLEVSCSGCPLLVAELSRLALGSSAVNGMLCPGRAILCVIQVAYRLRSCQKQVPGTLGQFSLRAGRPRIGGIAGIS